MKPESRPSSEQGLASAVNPSIWRGFEWHTTREAKCLQKLIPIDFDGTILLAGCWAHTRRAFYEALDHAPKEAGWILLQIGHLYEIERRLRRQRSGRALRDAYRSSQSRPICGRVRRMLQRWSIAKRFLPQSTMGKAIHYALEQWESLEVYLKDPLIEIDNNLVENAIRPTALGKKELAVLRRRQRRRTRCCDLLDH